MPNYALLGNIKDMMIPKKENPIIAGLDKYIKMQNDNKKLDAELSIAKAQQELYGVQGETARKKLEYLPQEMELERLKAQASINATNASAAAAHQGMGTESLRQQMMRNEMAAKQAATTYELAAGVKNADPTKKEAAYNFALSQAKAMGVDTSKLPQKWSPEAEAFVDNAYVASGRQLKDLQAQQQLAQAPVEAVIDPKTNKPVYVRRDQAAGMQPADPKLGGGAAGASPIAAELPKVQAKQLVALQTEAAETAQKANELKNQVKAFNGVTQNMSLDTGAKYNIPGSVMFSSDAQNAQQITKNLTLSASSVLKGALSDRDMANIEASMPSITNTPAANKKIINRLDAASTRAEQKPLFIQALNAQGVYDPSTINAAWTTFINEKPLFNNKTGDANMQNITAWKYYTSPEYVNKLTAGGATPAPGGQSSPANVAPTESKAINGKNYVKVDGQWYEQ
jgi:hypothetical protein